MRDKSQGVIFNIQRYSLQDGPGIRTTVFFKGCPLKCQWCSNPESQNTFPEVAHNNSLCNQCGVCLRVCERRAISLVPAGIKIDRALCNNCEKCLQECPLQALKVYGSIMTAESVLAVVLRDSAYYHNSGGGVTLSGGEPLMQPGFAIPLLSLCRRAGLHTAIETCGHVSGSVLAEALQYTDLVLYDLKQMDPATHLQQTGVSNDLILANARLVAASGVATIIRMPVVPGANDSEENLLAMARFVAGLKSIPAVELLPYHRFGISKYRMLDRDYKLEGLSSATVAQIEWVVKIFSDHGLKCRIVI